jgi:hypothetical protein
MMKGYDIFYENPGEIQERTCQVCGSIRDVKRDRMGSTGWAEGLAKRAHLHDYFRCPHAGEDWHEQALNIVMAIEETPSKRLAALMQQDLIDLLTENDIHIDITPN